MKFLNHSCAPNAYFIGANLVANRKIKANEEITISYIVTDRANAVTSVRTGSELSQAFEQFLGEDKSSQISNPESRNTERRPR